MMAPDVAKATLAGVASRAIVQLPGRLNQQSDSASQLRLQYLATKLHELGAPSIAHFLREVADGADVIAHAERCAKLPREFVHALGGDCFPERLISIDRGRR